MEATRQQIIASGLVWLTMLSHPLAMVFANVEGNVMNLISVTCFWGYIPWRPMDAFRSSVIGRLLLLLVPILLFLKAPR